MQKYDIFIIIHNFSTRGNVRSTGARGISRASRHILSRGALKVSACPILSIAACLSAYTNFPFAGAVIDRDRARFKDLERQRELTLHRGVLSRHAHVQTRGPRARTPGINQKYEMRPAEFRYIYGGGQFNDTHSRSRVIVNISIRSTPTTHAYADKPRGQRCFMRVQGAFDSAMRRASCCHLFAHYITLLPSRVSPANLHYKCR